MRRFPPIHIGSAEPYSGDLSRWYTKNNLAYGAITLVVTAGTDVASVSDIGYSNGRWSAIITGLKAGRAKITATGTATGDTKQRKQTFLVEVRDKGSLRSGQTYQGTEYC